ACALGACSLFLKLLELLEIRLELGQGGLAPEVTRVFEAATAVVSYSRTGKPGVLLGAHPTVTIAVERGQPPGGTGTAPRFFACALLYESTGDVAGGIGVSERAVGDVAVWVGVLAVERADENGVRGEKLVLGGIVEAAF